MESNTFARTSTRRYRIVNAEEISHSILFSTISSFCGLKMIDINKANINMNYEEYKKQHWIYFPSPKKSLQKQNRFEPCNVICHVTCLLHSIFIASLMHYPKNSPRVTFLSRTSRNWCTDPIHGVHHEMRIDISYNKH
jgi:hypothetical protein